MGTVFRSGSRICVAATKQTRYSQYTSSLPGLPTHRDDCILSFKPLFQAKATGQIVIHIAITQKYYHNRVPHKLLIST